MAFAFDLALGFVLAFAFDLAFTLERALDLAVDFFLGDAFFPTDFFFFDFFLVAIPKSPLLKFWACYKTTSYSNALRQLNGSS